MLRWIQADTRTGSAGIGSLLPMGELLMSRSHTVINVTALAFIGCVAFLVSFVAIRGVAMREGWSPLLASAFPLLVDTMTILGGSLVLARARDGDRAVYGWVLVASASLVSLAINVGHAKPTMPAQLLAMLPPVCLLAAVEAVMSEARRTQRYAQQSAGPDTYPAATAPVAPELHAHNASEAGRALVSKRWNGQEDQEVFSSDHGKDGEREAGSIFQ
jgi:hypothetical protein